MKIKLYSKKDRENDVLEIICHINTLSIIMIIIITIRITITITNYQIFVIQNLHHHTTQYSGGVSNLIYCCTLPDNKRPIKGSREPAQILLRFYGDQSRSNDDTALECEIFDLLSRKNLGPKLYGVFEGGRLEEFLQANSLTSEEIRDKNISKIIAKHLAVVHGLNVPIDKDESWLIERLNEWYESICNNADGDLSLDCQEHYNDREATLLIAKELLSINFKEEIEFIKSEIFEKSNSPKVFSHNDLHQGNILYVEPSKRRPSLEERIVFIDFEYCSYNYRAYDIANHLCEWLFQYGTQEYPHFECFQEKFPTKSDQLQFIRHYLSEKGRLQDATQLYEEVQPFYMAVSLFWTLWCIKQAQTSTIEFGYWEHAMARWRLYSQFKSYHLQQNTNYHHNIESDIIRSSDCSMATQKAKY